MSCSECLCCQSLPSCVLIFYNFLLRKAFGSRCLVLSAVRFVEKPLALEPTNCAAAHAFIAPGLKPWEDHPGSQQSRSLILDCVALFVGFKSLLCL